MDLTSQPVVIATLISLIATFLFTQVIARIIDHNYDKTYRELERNLQLRKLMGEDLKDSSLDELIRVQFNSYLLMKMSVVRKTKGHRFALFAIGLLSAGSLGLGVMEFLKDKISLSLILGAIALILGMVYFDRRKHWFRRSYVTNTKYKAILLGGKYDSGYTMIDIIPSADDGTFSTLDYPFVYVKDAITGTVYGYKRIRSGGKVSVASGEETNLQTEYAFQGIVAKESQIIFAKNPVIASLDVTLPDYFVPVMEEITVATMKPIKGAWYVLATVFRYFSGKAKARRKRLEDGDVEIIPTTTIPLVNVAGMKPSGSMGDTKMNPIIKKADMQGFSIPVIHPAHEYKVESIKKDPSKSKNESGGSQKVTPNDQEGNATENSSKP
jgi:hypothetical protein